MTGKLAGKVAVVTGAAGRGIGRAIARAYANEGAKVATIDRRAPVETHGVDTFVDIRADVSDPSQLVDALDRISQQVGPIDVLVNNAGITHRKPFLELTLDDWDEVHAVDVRPCFVATQWVARSLVSRGAAGSIINVASINARSVTRGQAHYCAAKGGVLQLTRASAVELAEHRIRVNALSPGVFETDFNRELLADREFRALRTGPIPLARVGMPDEIAPAAVLLASDDGSFLTGADIAIDGGQGAW